MSESGARNGGTCRGTIVSSVGFVCGEEVAVREAGRPCVERLTTPEAPLPTIPLALQPWLDALDGGILLCDRSGKVLGANRAAARLERRDRLPAELLRGEGAIACGNRYRAYRVEVRGGLAGYAVRVQLDVVRADEASAILRRKWKATDQEVAVFLAKRTGVKTAVAAENAGMTYKTADHHLAKLYKRVGVHGFVELEARIRRELAGDA